MIGCSSVGGPFFLRGCAAGPTERHAAAQQAGADSAAAEIMASARQNLANARAHQQQPGTRSRAALDAQQAAADAIYARERARRLAAEQQQAQAQAALQALPPQGPQGGDR
jgi:hypothetical protein